jgi:hypothetical protein
MLRQLNFFSRRTAGNGLVSYYLAKVLTSIGITERRTQNQINLGLMCWNLVTGVSGSFVQAVWPRRRQFLVGYGGMCVVFACWTGASATVCYVFCFSFW